MLLLALTGETLNTLQRPEEQGRLNVYYRELNELTAWLRKNVAPEPVLANFGVSAAILAYGDCPILLHPKFETEVIRNRVRAYGEVLFKGTEDEFRDWAEREGALFYVHALGEFANVGLNQQMRYMVDALQPQADTPAWLFERAPQRLKRFTLVWGNAKYRVFRIRCQADAIIAADQEELAEQALQRGLLDRAERHALEALARAPDNVKAQRSLRHVLSLREQGFHAGHDEKNNASPHPLRIALTGGMGCGKTTVAHLLQRLGAAVWDADEAVHRQLRPGTPAYRRIVKTFGPQMVRSGGGICRIALAAAAFADSRRRRSLENILHPAVIREMRTWLSLQRQKKQPAVVVVPLLFEAGLRRGWDCVVCVAADEEIALSRLRRRGNRCCRGAPPDGGTMAA